MKKISIGTLKMIQDRVDKAKSHGVEDLYTTHDSLIMQTRSNGKPFEEILILANGSMARRAATSLIRMATPQTMGELVRGYRLAKEAGLL